MRTLHEEDAYDNDRWFVKGNEVRKDNPNPRNEKDGPYHVWAPDAETAYKLAKKKKKGK